MTTQDKIVQHTTSLFAQEGYGGISMRNIAQKVQIVPSVLYHYYPDKDSLLKHMFDTLNTRLGIERAKLPAVVDASAMLTQRIEFQLDHAEEIVAVLKYYLTYRRMFRKIPTGFVPDKAYLHIEEVLIKGKETGEFRVENIKDDAKVITHAINGFILEYYPDIPKHKEKQQLIKIIHAFIIRALKGGEA